MMERDSRDSIRGSVGLSDDRTMVELTFTTPDGNITVQFHPDVADELSASLSFFALELRNGGRLQ